MKMSVDELLEVYRESLVRVSELESLLSECTYSSQTPKIVTETVQKILTRARSAQKDALVSLNERLLDIR